MKTTRNMMMSLVLAGSMILGASFASAQTMSGRQRPTTSSSSSRSTTTRSTVSNNRSVTTTSNTKSSMTTSSSSRTSTPQVRQSSSSSGRTVTQRPSTPSSTTPRVSTASQSRNSTVTARPASGRDVTTSRPSTVTARPETRTITTGTTRTTTGSTGTSTSVRNGNTSRHTTGSMVPDNNAKNENAVVRGSVRNSHSTGSIDNGKPNDKPNGNVGGGKGKDKDNRGNYSDNRGGSRGGGNRPHVAKPENNPYRNHFSDNHRHNNWSRPLPPPPRPYRPAPIRYYRPVVPAHYRPYAGAPVIDRILGLSFGSLFNVSLNYLYTNNYYIDGYDSDIIYLRDVRMLNLLWPDVMLCYDSYGRLANAQFVISTGYTDRSRYNRLYHDLCAVYGPPISVDAAGATWFGGNTTGYVTLSTALNGARFYTTLSVGY